MIGLHMDIVAALADWSVGPGPLHRKLTDALRAAIERGTLPAGTPLPAERALARMLAVSRSTVVVAYDALRAEGLLERRQGSGTRVAADLPPVRRDGTVEGGTGATIFRRLIEGPGEVISLACATSPAHPAVGAAFGALTAEGVAPVLAGHGYLPLGLPALREAIAELHSRAGLSTRPEQVLVTTGAHQALHLIAGLLVRPGDTVVVENPSFAGVIDVFRAAGARLAPVAVDDEGADVAAMEALVRRGVPAAVYVMPSFHNPVGVAMSRSRRHRLARLAAESGVPIIEDNALQHASLGAAPPPAVAALADDAAASILTVGSLSKSLWGGLRVGWVRAPEEVVARLARLKALADLGSPVIDQIVAAHLVPDLERLAAERSAHLREQCARLEALLAERLPSWRWTPPQGGGSLWVRLPHGDAASYAQVALRHGVEVVPGAAMSPDATHTDHLRVPFTFDDATLDALVDRLAEAWRRYAPTGHATARDLAVVV
jgi:DNA-binding transcriptional MocR family regulator